MKSTHANTYTQVNKKIGQNINESEKKRKNKKNKELNNLPQARR